ncbi:MAG: hypothetical protein DRH37_01230 [Deltaproteobacteria bacterium]|nr:MAG: hypothetical protein DRH37_01230 [Deltaproteobacteria bacterium]
MTEIEQTDQIPLDIVKEAGEIKTMYEEDPAQDSFSCLLLGEAGSGKTYFLRTCRKPVHIDSFDPGGTKGIKKHIKSGEIIAATNYEKEDPMKPWAFNQWKKDMDRRIKMGYFNHVGTYVLDSASTWSDAIMNQILKNAGIPGQAPRFTKDYVPQKMQIRNWIAVMMALPCDFIMTGHLEAFKDEVSGTVTYRFLTTGKGVVTIPGLFDELWVCDPKESSKGVNYRILTKSTGRHIARSRLAENGKLAQYEEPDMKKILAKVGHDNADKPLLTE